MDGEYAGAGGVAEEHDAVEEEQRLAKIVDSTADLMVDVTQTQLIHQDPRLNSQFDPGRAVARQRELQRFLAENQATDDALAEAMRTFAASLPSSGEGTGAGEGEGGAAAAAAAGAGEGGGGDGGVDGAADGAAGEGEEGRPAAAQKVALTAAQIAENTVFDNVDQVVAELS